MRFDFEDTKPVILDADLLADLRRIAQELGLSTMPARIYRQKGAFSATVIKKRFGSWNKALSSAGLGISGERDIPDELLLDNLREVWIKLGRQPRTSEMVPPVSNYTRHPYKRRFGSWLAAMKAFVQSVEQSEAEDKPLSVPGPNSRGPRDPSLRLRFRVMRRDNFKCRCCGRSPATDPSVELHVDHTIAWANGGLTLFENLQTLCTKCNLGKSDLSIDGAG